MTKASAAANPVRLTAKLIKVQQEIGAVKKGSVNPFYNSSYVEINGLLQAVLPVLQKHGILLTQPLSTVDGNPAITTILADADSNDNVSGTITIPKVDDAQKMGAAITYFRRYGVLSMLGLGAEDDDGNAASGKKAPAKASAVAASGRKQTSKKAGSYL